MDIHGLELHQRQLIEQQEFETQQRQAREEAERQSRAAHEARLDAAQAERDTTRREQEAADLDERLRQNFVAQNPSASAEEIERLLPRLREEHMVQQARIDPVQAEADLLRSRHPNDYEKW